MFQRFSFSYAMCAISFQAQLGHVGLRCLYVCVSYLLAQWEVRANPCLHLSFALQSHPWPPPLTDLLCHSLSGLSLLLSHTVSSVPMVSSDSISCSVCVCVCVCVCVSAWCHAPAGPLHAGARWALRSGTVFHSSQKKTPSCRAYFLVVVVWPVTFDWSCLSTLV